MSSHLTSDLCKPLPLVLIDQSHTSMLDYFIQFMESEKALHLVQFWLSVEAFKTAPPSSCGGVSCEGVCIGRCNALNSVRYGGCEAMTCADNDSVRSGKCDPITGVKCETITGMKCEAVTGVKCEVVTGVKCEAVTGVKCDGVMGGPATVTTRAASCLDAMEIYTTYLALNALTPVDLPHHIRQKIEVNICPEDGLVDRGCFKEAQDFIYNTLESQYYPAFLRSSFLCRYQLEYISSGQLTLLDFLLADNALFYFMEYMEIEGASSLVQFWLMAHNFYCHLSHPQHTPDPVTDTRDAIAIYDRFFSLQASEPLGTDDVMRIEIETRICSEEGPQPDSYIPAQDWAYQTLQQKYYSNFLESAIYLRFLNELVHMLNASSATVETHYPKPSLKPIPEWRDDLDNPNSLWQREHLPLRLGFVDQFGRYVSEIDTLPSKGGTVSGGLSNRALRRRQQEEELTMKIAVNIISEVIELTRIGTRKLQKLTVAR